MNGHGTDLGAWFVRKLDVFVRLLEKNYDFQVHPFNSCQLAYHGTKTTDNATLPSKSIIRLLPVLIAEETQIYN